MKGLAFEWMMGLIALGVGAFLYILFYEIFASHLYPYFTSTVTDSNTLITGNYLSMFWQYGVPVLFVFIVGIYILTRSQEDYR